MKVGDKVKFFESAKHRVEEAILTKVHEGTLRPLVNVEVIRKGLKVAFHSVGLAMEHGGAYIVAHTQPDPPKEPPKEGEQTK